MLRLAIWTAMAGVVLAAASADALAATAETVPSSDRRWVVYRAAPGEENRLRVRISTGSTAVGLTDAGAQIAPGPGCESVRPDAVVCRIAGGVRLVQAALADGDDRADAETPNARAAQINITGGAGDDLLRGHGPSRFGFGGNEGDDLLAGSDGPDVLRGQAGADFLSGHAGADLLIGDEGRDVLRAGLGVDRLFGGRDGDKLDARDQPSTAEAVVSCGSGTDTALEDRVDRPKTTGCEVIRG